MTETLYARLGGYDAISAVAENLLSRLTTDDRLGRFWHNRGRDGVQREKQLLIDFLCASAGGPLYYAGRDRKTSHRGMGIDESDWQVFRGHLEATLDRFEVPETERAEVLAFIESTKADIARIAPGPRPTGKLQGAMARSRPPPGTDRLGASCLPPDDAHDGSGLDRLIHSKQSSG